MAAITAAGAALLLIRTALAAGGALDACASPWPGPSSGPARTPLHSSLDSLAQLGDDGLPAWHWPALPGNQATYRSEVEIPRRFVVDGLLMGSIGPAANADTVRLTLRDGFDAALLDTTLVLHGHGLPEEILLRRSVTLEGGERLRMEITSHNPARPPWITADDDCHAGNRSWIRVPALGDAFQVLDRDLSLRALGRWAEGDQQPPLLRAAAEPAWNLQLGDLPLRVRLRDESGVDSVWVESQDGTWSRGLARLGPWAADPAWEEWGALLRPAALVEAGETTLDLRLVARDGAGNEGGQSLPTRIDPELHWMGASGRADQAWRPGAPLVPGTVLAQRVPLGRLRSEHNLISAVVAGVRLEARGGGELLLRLVQDAQGRPAREDNRWVQLADSLRLVVDGTCPGPVAGRFANPVEGVSQGSQAWLLLDYSLPSHATAAPAPLLESHPPGGPPPDSLLHSWSWTPLENDWHALPAGTLLIEALIEAESCDFQVPFLADFDATFAGLECWQESHPAGSLGWTSSAQGASASFCYQPGNAFFDPDDLRSGSFLFINSDAQENATQNDTLVTPWLRFDEGALLSFSSCMGNSGFDLLSQVLARRRTGGVAEDWQQVLAMEEMLALGDSTLDPSCGGRHPNWSRVSASLAPAGEAGEIQLAFNYQGSFGTGWAIDSVRVDPAGGGVANDPWDGPAVKAAELGRIHPNPFNPETVIPFRLRRSGALRLEVYNLAGQRVAVLVDEPFRRAGEHRAVFRPGPLASGIYLARLESEGAVDTRRLIYLK
jgi:hypothetical protein